MQTRETHVLGTYRQNNHKGVASSQEKIGLYSTHNSGFS